MATSYYQLSPFGQAYNWKTMSFGHDEHNDMFHDEPALFDDSSLAKLDQIRETNNDMVLFSDSPACYDSFSQQQDEAELPLWSLGADMTLSPELDTAINFGSPESTLCPSPPPSSPAATRLLRYSSEMPDAEHVQVAESTYSSDSDSEATLTPPSPIEAAKVISTLPKSPLALHFRHSNNSHYSKRQRQAIRNQRQQDHNDSDDEHGEGTEVPHGKGIRQPHKIVEQRYRNTLNAEIRRLQMAIPHLAEFQRSASFQKGRPQPTKATIIASAVQYIKLMELERDALLAGKGSKSKFGSRK